MDDPLDRLRADLAAAEERAVEYLTLARLAQTELQSYRRRIELARVDDAQAARSAAVEQLLPLLDDLDRALEHLPDDLAEHPWAKGVMLTGLNLQSALGHLGVERFGAPGDRFDPASHEAIGHEPTADVPPDHVASVVRPGYRSGERLIRAAQVVVAREPEPAPEPAREVPQTRSPGSVIDRRA